MEGCTKEKRANVFATARAFTSLPFANVHNRIDDINLGAILHEILNSPRLPSPKNAASVSQGVESHAIVLKWWARPECQP